MTHNTDCEVLDEFRDDLDDIGRRVQSLGGGGMKGLPTEIAVELEDLGWDHLGRGAGRSSWLVPQDMQKGTVETPTQDTDCVVKFARATGGFAGGLKQNQEEVGNYQTLPDRLVEGTETELPLFVPLKDWSGDYYWVSLPRADARGGSGAEMNERLAQNGWECNDIRNANVGEIHGTSIILDYGLECWENESAVEPASDLAHMLEDRGARAVVAQAMSRGSGAIVEFLPPTGMPGDNDVESMSSMVVKGGQRAGVDSMELVFGTWDTDQISTAKLTDAVKDVGFEFSKLWLLSRSDLMSERVEEDPDEDEADVTFDIELADKVSISTAADMYSDMVATMNIEMPGPSRMEADEPTGPPTEPTPSVNVAERFDVEEGDIVDVKVDISQIRPVAKRERLRKNVNFDRVQQGEVMSVFNDGAVAVMINPDEDEKRGEFVVPDDAGVELIAVHVDEAEAEIDERTVTETVTEPRAPSPAAIDTGQLADVDRDPDLTVDDLEIGDFVVIEWDDELVIGKAVRFTTEDGEPAALIGTRGTEFQAGLVGVGPAAEAHGWDAKLYARADADTARSTRVTALVEVTPYQGGWQVHQNEELEGEFGKFAQATERAWNLFKDEEGFKELRIVTPDLATQEHVFKEAGPIQRNDLEGLIDAVRDNIGQVAGRWEVAKSRATGETQWALIRPDDELDHIFDTHSEAVGEAIAKRGADERLKIERPDGSIDFYEAGENIDPAEAGGVQQGTGLIQVREGLGDWVVFDGGSRVDVFNDWEEAVKRAAGVRDTENDRLVVHIAPEIERELGRNGPIEFDPGQEIVVTELIAAVG